MVTPTFLVPVRGLNTSMLRLRENLDDVTVDRVVQKLLENTISSLQLGNCPVIIVTADQSLTEESYGCPIIYDSGIDLNMALQHAVSTLSNEEVGIIMPDLPGFSGKSLAKFLKVHEIHGNLIVPTADKGTAMAILKKDYFSKGFFGPGSSEKIINHANHVSDTIAKVIIQQLERDLDTIDDYQYWYTD